MKIGLYVRLGRIIDGEHTTLDVEFAALKGTLTDYTRVLYSSSSLSEQDRIGLISRAGSRFIRAKLLVCSQEYYFQNSFGKKCWFCQVNEALGCFSPYSTILSYVCFCFFLLSEAYRYLLYTRTGIIQKACSVHTYHIPYHTVLEYRYSRGIQSSKTRKNLAYFPVSCKLGKPRKS